MTSLKLGDNAKLRAIDEALGWVEPDGSSPASVAESQGVSSHIVGSQMGLPDVFWQSHGTWSYCVLHRHGLTTTLLARSQKGLSRLLNKLYERVNSEVTGSKWRPYYNGLWDRRYRKWVHRPGGGCDCQLCRMGRT